MPTYTYTSGNQQVSSETPLTEAELDEVFGGQEKQEGSLLAESARKGASSGVALMAGIAGAANELARGRPLSMVQGFTQQYEPVEQGMLEILGSTGVKPKTQSEQIAGGAVQGLFDPTTYLLPGAKYLKETGPVVKGIYKALEGSAGGAGGEAGGIVGENVGGEYGRVGGAIIGGGAAGTVVGGAPRIATKTVPYAIKKTQSLIAKIKGTEPVHEAYAMAEKHIDRIFIEASRADPNFADALEEAITAQERTGVKMPLSAMMKDNPVINAYIGHLASTDGNFKSQYFQQFEQAKNSLKGKTEMLFGTPVDADSLLNKSVASKAEDFKVESRSALRQGNRLKDAAASEAAKLDSVSPYEFGARITDITEAAEKNARKNVSPAYTAAFDIARAKNLELPATEVQDIYDTVVNSKSSDIFYTFPSIYQKVKRTFAPKQAAEGDKGVLQMNEAGEMSWGEAQPSFSSASIEDLDSLKQEVNRQIRKSRDAKEIRVLEELKSKVDGVIGNLDPDFSAAYKSADKRFLQEVGLPFSEETIKSISRAKFNENIVPLLTRNKSTTSQFISATGESGKKLVEDAFVSDFANFAVKDGVIDNAKARAWFTKNSNQLQAAPEIESNLRKVTSSSESLLARQSAINDALDEAGKTRILKSSGMNTQQLLGQMYGSTSYTDRFLKQYGNDKDAMRAVRSFMLDDIVSSENPLTVLNDRTKSSTYEKVFGSAYKDIVKNLAVVSDRITKDPSAVKVNIKGISPDILTSTIGMPPERLTSLFFTNPVVSKPVAIMTVVNRFFNKQAGQIAEKKMKELLLDKEAGTRLLHAMRTSGDGTLDLERVNNFAKWAAGRGFDFVDMIKQDAAAGAMRSGRGMNEEEMQQYEEEYQ